VQDSGALAGPRPGVNAEYAGFWRRFAGLFIDGILLAVVGSVIAAVLPGGREGALASILQLVLGIGYQVYFFTSTGQTLGMKVMGTKIVDGNGGLPTMSSAAIRYIGSLVSGAILLIGFLWMLWDANKQTLHDKMAGTYIVKA
jgi:uncharacterized RDD family membrane protein YckC